MSLSSRDDDFFQIGRRNFVELKRMLWRNGVIVRDQSVGGSLSRSLSVDVATGEVVVKAGGSAVTLSRRFPRRLNPRSEMRWPSTYSW